MKKSGILLAISSLPAQHGIGDFGPNAYEFVDILVATKANIWQVLPLTPLGYGNSPYQSSSSFAGDEIYISLDKLVDIGLLEAQELKNINRDSSEVEYDKVRKLKQKYLSQAFANFQESKDKFEKEYLEFLVQNKWLENYAIFQTFRTINNNQIWYSWPDDYKYWHQQKNIDIRQYQPQIDYQIFLQFIFYKQWFELKEYANSNNIEIMGDLPIYLGLDSAEIWQYPQYFQLDKSLKPTFVAGVPPDFFSATGQLWGNPLYDWDKLEDTNFEFWLERLKGNFKLFDILRVDHFRAFDTYWQIPAGQPTAVDGKWLEAPGYKLFDTVFQALPNANVIAEDLGELRQEVFKLRDHYKLKGMKVFIFHFDFKSGGFIENSNIVAYSGTHDNNTLRGWYDSQLSKYQRKLLKRFFRANDKNIITRIVRYLLKCDAEYVILPVQDILELDAHGRLNTPGTVGSPNWQWKLTNFDDLLVKLNDLDFVN